MPQPTGAGQLDPAPRRRDASGGPPRRLAVPRRLAGVRPPGLRGETPEPGGRRGGRRARPVHCSWTGAGRRLRHGPGGSDGLSGSDPDGTRGRRRRSFALESHALRQGQPARRHQRPARPTPPPRRHELGSNRRLLQDAFPDELSDSAAFHFRLVHDPVGVRADLTESASATAFPSTLDTPAATGADGWLRLHEMIPTEPARFLRVSPAAATAP